MIKLKLVILTYVSLFTALATAITPAPPALGADGYILMDFHSGQVIAERNADEPLPPASLTKMMTSYVVSSELAAGNISRDDMVTISKNA